MGARAGIRAALLADATIRELVGTRVYPLQAPQGERRPLIVLMQVSETASLTLQGEDGLRVTRMQVDCWALDIDTATHLAAQVRRVLTGLRGLHAGQLFAGIWPEFLREGQDAQTGQYFVGRDFRMVTRQH